MQIDILTIFPEMFEPVLNESILKRAQEKGLITVQVHNLRDWTTDKHKVTDDRPFGGGPGMVMKPEPIFRAVEELKNKRSKDQKSNKSYKNSNIDVNGQTSKVKCILMTPKGDTFTQQTAQKLSKLDHLILICGRYEGVDQRVHDYLVDQKISIGNYVLTGGELPAMVVTDAITRLIPGVLGNPESLTSESFNTTKAKLSAESLALNPQFDYPVYTQPRSFKYRGKNPRVPEILLTGDHQKIAKWRDNH